MSTQDTPPKRPRFRVHGVATIKHLNVRKEGPEDEKVLAVDVKLVIDKLPRTVCDYFDEALVPFLWRGDPATDALIVRNAFLRPIAYAHEVSNAFVRIDNGVFHGCDVGKFSLEPRDGGTVDLTCSVAIYPSANDVSDLAKHVQDGVHVAIEGPPDLFNADDNPAAAATDLDGLMRESGGSAVLSSSDGSAVMSFGDGPDPLLGAARELILEHGRASISLVQRHLRIGYNRAARLLEELEKAGVISGQDKEGLRSVLAAPNVRAKQEPTHDQA